MSLAKICKATKSRIQSYLFGLLVSQHDRVIGELTNNNSWLFVLTVLQDWKSSEHQETFFNSEEHKSLVTGLGQVVNFSKSAARRMIRN
jgi:hypothetical protein